MFSRVFSPFEGKSLMICAPSRQWVTPTGEVDFALHHRAREAAEALGFEVFYQPGSFKLEARFAGDDKMRAQEFVRALETSGMDLVMALRGGYGAARLLAQLSESDWARIEASTTPIVGYSDFTAINLALLATVQKVSWHGPTLRDLIDPDPLTLKQLAMVMGLEAWEVDWTVTEHRLESESERTLPRSPAFKDDYQVITGPLWGGNLSVLTSLIGTPYFPPIEGGILCLEDIAEPAYRVDRQLIQLYEAGILTKQACVVLGEFTGIDKASAWAEDFSSRSVGETLIRLGVPFVTGCPMGHQKRKVSLPIGETVRLSVAQTNEGATRVRMRLANGE